MVDIGREGKREGGGSRAPPLGFDWATIDDQTVKLVQLVVKVTWALRSRCTPMHIILFLNLKTLYLHILTGF